MTARSPRAPRAPRQTESIGKRTKYGEPLALDLRTGELDRDWSRRPRHWKGGQVNAKTPLPKSPGSWVDLEDCAVCGELYKRWHGSGASWDAAVDSMEDGAFKSRGPVLWRMRVLKVQEWYMRHSICGEWARDLKEDGVKLPQSASWAILHGDGCISSDSGVSQKGWEWLFDEGLICYTPDEEFGF